MPPYQSLFVQSQLDAEHPQTLCFAPENFRVTKIDFERPCSFYTSGLVVTYLRPSGSSETQSLRPRKIILVAARTDCCDTCQELQWLCQFDFTLLSAFQEGHLLIRWDMAECAFQIWASQETWCLAWKSRSQARLARSTVRSRATRAANSHRSALDLPATSLFVPKSICFRCLEKRVRGSKTGCTRIFKFTAFPFFIRWKSSYHPVGRDLHSC